MKIIEDKVKLYPPHAICRVDIPKILSAVPPELVTDIKIVRLSAANPHPHIAAYNPFDCTLTIKSRGRTKERTLHQVFTELAVHGMGITVRWGKQLQARDVSRVRVVVAPLVDQVLPLLSQKKVWLDR